MVYLVCGKEEMLVKRRVAELIFRFEEKHGKENIIRSVWDADEDLDLIGIENFLGLSSLFNDKKLLIIKGLFNKEISDLVKILKDYDIESQKDLLVIFSVFSDKKNLSKKNLKLWNFLSKSGSKTEELRELKGIFLSNWVKSRLSEYNLKISPKALQEFILYAQNDIYFAEQEINKLVCYKKSGIIEDGDIKEIASKNESISGFAIVDALCSKNKARAVEMFYKYLSSGQDPQMLFGAIIYQFRNLLVIGDMLSQKIPYTQISKNLKLHPFVIKKTHDIAKKTDLKGSKLIYNHLADIEKKVKSGILSIDEGIFDLIVRG